MSEKINYTFIIILFVLIGVAIGALEILYSQGAFQNLVPQNQQAETTTTTMATTTTTTTIITEVPLLPGTPSGNENPPLPPS